MSGGIVNDSDGGRVLTGSHSKVSRDRLDVNLLEKTLSRRASFEEKCITVA